MLWERRFQKDGFAIETLESRGAPLPQWYLDEPPMGPLDSFYTDCYWALNTTRRFPGGPIPWDTIVKYAEYSGLDSYMTGVLTNVIRAMDSRLLESEEKAAERKRKSDSRSHKRR